MADENQANTGSGQSPAGEEEVLDVADGSMKEEAEKRYSQKTIVDSIINEENMKHNMNIRLLSNLDDFFRYTQPISSMNAALSNNLFGINSLNTKPILPLNRDHQGFTFFTRPQLCLSVPNLRNDRTFVSMLTSDTRNIHHYLRVMLDPRIAKNPTQLKYSVPWKDEDEEEGELQESPLVDISQAFLPPLTNNIISCTGWPDPVLPSYTSKANNRGGQWAIGDGITKIYNTFDLNCTFKNVKENPILLMMLYWTNYIANVVDGIFLPYPDYLASNVIDYNTRIYRIITDESKKYVKMIAACGAAYPNSPDLGKYFNFNDGNPYSDQTSEISVNFKCMGAMYNDPILIDEFNKTVCIFESKMSLIRNFKMGQGGSNFDNVLDQIGMFKIPQSMMGFFNYRSIPFIDYATLELEWYVDTQFAEFEQYKKFIGEKRSIPKKKKKEEDSKEGSKTDNPEKQGESK